MKLVLALSLICLLPGCLNSILPKPADRAIYTLPDPIAGKSAVALPAALLVETPRALAPLDSEELVVQLDSGEVQLLPGARWAAPGPLLLQDLIARQLEAHSAAPTVTQSAQAQRLPLRLVSELRDFGLRQSEGKLLAELSLSARLICTPDARVLGAKVLNLESGPVTDDPALAIAALRALSGSLALQVSDWLGTVDARSCLDP